MRQTHQFGFSGFVFIFVSPRELHAQFNRSNYALWRRLIAGYTSTSNLMLQLTVVSSNPCGSDWWPHFLSLSFLSVKTLVLNKLCCIKHTCTLTCIVMQDGNTNIKHRIQQLGLGWVGIINSSSLGQNGRQFADDFSCIFVNETFCIFTKDSFKFIP